MYIDDIEPDKVYPDEDTVRYNYFDSKIPVNKIRLPHPEQFPNLSVLYLTFFPNDMKIPYYKNLTFLQYSPFNSPSSDVFDLLVPEHAVKLSRFITVWDYRIVPFFINVKYYEFIDLVNRRYRLSIESRKILVSLFKKGLIREKYLLQELFIVHEYKY
jgi:hypothetical protein